MNKLFYSEKCKFCQELLGFIDQHNELKQVTQFYDINRSGVPQGITRVPTLVKQDGMLVGRDISEYLESLLMPVCQGNQCKLGTTLDGTADDDMFSLDKYGTSLAPTMTKELQAKISADVKSSFQSYEH